MKQPIRKTPKKRGKKKIKSTARVENRPSKPKAKEAKYGTSKLEKDFANEFLVKYGINFIYEYEAKDIKRFYDFAIVSKRAKYITENKEGLESVIQGIQHTPIDLLVEIDGGYWHSDPRVVDETKLNAIQKHNKMVDEIKDKWARLHGMPLIRIWEYDIRHDPKKVLGELKKYIHIEEPKSQPKSKRVMKLKSVKF